MKRSVRPSSTGGPGATPTDLRTSRAMRREVPARHRPHNVLATGLRAGILHPDCADVPALAGGLRVFRGELSRAGARGTLGHHPGENDWRCCPRVLHLTTGSAELFGRGRVTVRYRRRGSL